jgi:hypothetical protein
VDDEDGCGRIGPRKGSRESHIPAPTLEGLWKSVIVDASPRETWTDHCLMMVMGVDLGGKRIKQGEVGRRGGVDEHGERGKAQRSERTWWLCCGW